MTFLLVVAITVAAFVIWRYARVRPPVLAAGRPTLDDALAHTPASVIRLDAEGHVVSLHGGWERCTGWSAGETIGKHYLGFIPAEDRARTRALEDRLRDSTLTEIAGTVRLTARGGTMVTSQVHLFPQREPTGRVSGAVLIATQAPTDRQPGMQLLEGAAPDAVAAPIALNGTGRDALGKTLAGLAHELNNPLAVITGFAQILLRSSPAPDDRHAIESILGEARRATSLIRDVITVARGEAHTPAERIDLNALVMSAVARFRPILESKGITLSATLADAELIVEGVPAQMDRVIHNLIRNAQRHLAQCSADACTLSVSTSRESGDIALEVADSGPPLSAEELERIWDPFAVTGDDADVSGFELAVAHSLVRAQGGSITVSSDRDHGTVFRVKWRAMAQASSSPDTVAGARTAGPLDVLVVEDEVTLRDLLSRYLQLRGHAVVLAEGGEQALRLAEQNTFDVVVSDVRMPGIGGPELVRRLRQRPSCAHTRFVLSTGDALLDLGDLAREGVTGVHLVHKPYDVSRLASIIESP